MSDPKRLLIFLTIVAAYCAYAFYSNSQKPRMTEAEQAEFDRFIFKGAR